MSAIKIGIITVSDRASAGIYEDISGKAIIDTLNDYLVSTWKDVYEVVPDEQNVIEKTIINMVEYVSTAILSRQTAGLRGTSLIINLPGKPKSIRECLDAVFPAVPYCIDLMEGPFLECNEAVIKPFRPNKK